MLVVWRRTRRHDDLTVLHQWANHSFAPGVAPHMTSLATVFEGWDGYQASLAEAIRPLTPAQLAWRPAADRRSVGEIVRHISAGRITWFARMGAPGIDEAMRRVPRWEVDQDGARHVVEDAIPADDPQALVEWLIVSWHSVERVLRAWTVADLAVTYEHRWRGKTYAVSRQWTVWRIMAHDIHHGGQIAMLLGIQDIDAFALRQLGGHIIMPPLARAPSDAEL